MPAHFHRFIQATVSPGLLIIAQSLDLREAIEQLLLIWAASEAEDWVNVAGYMPL